MSGLLIAVAGLLMFLAGMVTAAGLLARYVVREDAREQRADEWTLTAYRAANLRTWGDCDMSQVVTQQVPFVPVQRVPEGAAA